MAISLSYITPTQSHSADTTPTLGACVRVRRQAQRYGHPCERPILASSVPPPAFVALVESFFHHGLTNVTPRNYWGWAEVRLLAVEFERSIPFETPC